MKAGRWLTIGGLVAAVATTRAQTVLSAKVAILLAEERGAADARDLATLRAGIRNVDEETALTAVRALGRLGRPSLIPDIAVALRSALPELRAEAADAMASSLVAPRPAASKTAVITFSATVASALSTLLARLNVEAEPSVRAAICEAVGRLPLSDPTQMSRVESALTGRARTGGLVERLGASESRFLPDREPSA